MMRVIDNNRLKTMKKAIPLSELIRYWLPDLKKIGPNGDNHYSICPFHIEKTASFCVNDKKGIYHCFGCGAHGDHIWFLEEARIENIRRRMPGREHKPSSYLRQLCCGDDDISHKRIAKIFFMDHIRKLSQITGIPIKGEYKVSST